MRLVFWLFDPMLVTPRPVPAAFREIEVPLVLWLLEPMLVTPRPVPAVLVERDVLLVEREMDVPLVERLFDPMLVEPVRLEVLPLVGLLGARDTPFDDALSSAKDGSPFGPRSILLPFKRLRASISCQFK